MIVLAVLSVCRLVSPMKLRSWLGPTYFFEGPLPIQKMRLGLASAPNGKLFEFGGQDSDGELP